MSKYKITVVQIDELENGKYPNNITIYEQTVSGDETIVNGVVQAVLEYNTLQMTPIAMEQEA
jgi:hypothetical protein